MKKEINIKNNKFLLLDPTILLLKRYFCGKKKLANLIYIFLKIFITKEISLTKKLVLKQNIL